MTGLKGKLLEAAYNKAMKELFEKFQIIAYGEVDDGAFPSLAVGATESIYEDLYLESKSLSSTQAQLVIDNYIDKDTLFLKFLNKVLKAQS